MLDRFKQQTPDPNESGLGILKVASDEERENLKPAAPAQDSRLEVHDQLFKQAQEASFKLFHQRNAEYDGTIDATGLLGSTVEVVGISARLKKIVIKSGTFGKDFPKDKLLDLYKDLANYAIISMMNIAENNWTGK